jgi:hypothetical protein
MWVPIWMSDVGSGMHVSYGAQDEYFIYMYQYGHLIWGPVGIPHPSPVAIVHTRVA